MIGSVSLAGYSGAVGSTEKTSSASGFDSVLRNEFGGFDYFKSSMNEYYGDSFFHVLDMPKTPHWNRRDFPSEIFFNESCTQAELDRVSLPAKEPLLCYYGDTTKTEKIAFIASPAAAEKMKSDIGFCNEVMDKITAVVSKTWYGELEEDLDKNYDCKLIAARVVVNISDDGTVKFNFECTVQGKRHDEECSEEIKECIKKLLVENADVSVSVADEAVPHEEVSQGGETDELFFDNAAFAVSDILLRNYRR